jgi:RNA polymerase sigma factor (sigma-70 family)
VKLKHTYQNIHQKIIDRCATNDRNAQFELYKLYYKNMYNTAYRILNDPMEAEDVMQESFLAAFNKLKTYRGEVSFGAWLKRIVINRSVDMLNRKKIKYDDIDQVGHIPEGDDDNDEAEIQKYHIKKIKQAVQELDEGYRVVFNLYYLEGYDHEEISQILHITASTSRSQLTRARKKIIEYMGTIQK